MTARREKFRAWLLDPARNTLDLENFPASFEGMKAMVEEALWNAYRQGYRACRDDVLTAIEQEPDDMPAEIDFSKGERGKFKPKGR